MTTHDTPGPIRATVEIAFGQLRIRTADVITTTVDVRPSDPNVPADVDMAERTTVHLDDGALVVRDPRRGATGLVRSWLRRDGKESIDVAIECPAGTSLDASLGAGDIAVDGQLGDCRVRTGLGSIDLETTGDVEVRSGAGGVTVGRVNGHGDVTTGSGTVRIGEVAGSAVVRNSNGTTRVDTVDGHLRVKAANGAVEIGRVRGDVVAKSANGEVSVDEVAQGTVVLETQIGDIEVGIPPGVAAWLDLDATAGTVDNRLDATPDAGQDGGVEVRARTTLGRILVRRPRATHHA